ncbi:metallophosphoesterase [Halomonas binhaiensis]|uniref:Metallophosphoesterase n=1 Tax=Halomonas binhaiensis TaxID=2562282 RepID=A0A5C1NNH3_9GAMM|nr:metallophosphoesterase [Halomonas binhaiensis]
MGSKGIGKRRGGDRVNQLTIQRHGTNTEGRDFFVGDIHGQYGLLLEAMARVGFNRQCDRMFSVGDLIDRGKESYQCLSLAFEPWFHGVRGNHEMLAHDALLAPDEDGRAFLFWVMNGGTWIHGESLKEVSSVLADALEHLPYAREVATAGKRVGIVHAEPPEDWTQLESTDPYTLLWGRNRIHQEDTTHVVNIDDVVVGHTILYEPVVMGNVHYIDTGAFYTGRLTLAQAEDLLG